MFKRQTDFAILAESVFLWMVSGTPITYTADSKNGREKKTAAHGRLPEIIIVALLCADCGRFNSYFSLNER